MEKEFTNIKIIFKLSFVTIGVCGIKGKCKYKFFRRCFVNWNRKGWREDAICVINEKLCRLYDISNSESEAEKKRKLKEIIKKIENEKKDL